MTSTSGPGQTRGIVLMLVLGVVALLVVGAMLMQESRLGADRAKLTPVQVYRPPADSTPSPSPSLPSPTRTEMGEPGSVLTSTLLATPAPLRLAVEESVRARYGKYFSSLEVQYPGLMLIAYPGDEEVDHLLAAQTSDWTVFWAREQIPGSTLLRREPFVVIVNPSWPEDILTMDTLRAWAEGQGDHMMVTPDGGQATRELLSLKQIAPHPIRVTDWQAVQEYVATHANAWALVPWDAVTFRVRILPVDGKWPALDDLQDYVLVRSLWLTGDIPIPDALQTDLAAALKYDPLPTVELVAVGGISCWTKPRGKCWTNTDPPGPLRAKECERSWRAPMWLSATWRTPSPRVARLSPRATPFAPIPPSWGD
jgi:hypothetical protein